MQDDAAKSSQAEEGTAQSWPSQTKESGLDVVVDFAGEGDPYNPQNWSFAKKVVTTVLWALTTCWMVFATAIYSAGIGQIIEQFHVNSATAAAGVGLMMFGFGLGPLIWAPLSEVYGRKWSALVVSNEYLFFISIDIFYSTPFCQDMLIIFRHISLQPLSHSAPLPLKTCRPS